ncbi:hypothetical protein Ndes2526B_g06768 [Nannochloris sp. 'desiccata']
MVLNHYDGCKTGIGPANCGKTKLLQETTKEDHLGHFVLASSESFVIDFLEKEGLHSKQYVTHEIGDLATIDEAKQFVESLMLY